MNIARLKQNLFSPSEKLQMKYTLWMNHLLVVYAFLLPISHHAKAQIQVSILVLFLIRGNFKKYMSETIKNRVVQAFLFFFFMYIFWLYGTENFTYAKTLINQNRYAFIPLIFLSFMDKRFSNRVLSALLLGVFFSEITSYLISFHIIPPILAIGKTIIYSATTIDPAPFQNHSKYGMLLSISIVLLINKILYEQNSLAIKIISSFFVLSSTINIFIIGGRIGYLTYTILILFLSILYFKKKTFKVFPILLIIISVIFIFSYNNSSIFKNRINQTINSINIINKDKQNFHSSIGQRIGIWYYSTKVIKENYLFGVGTGDHVNSVRDKLDAKHKYLKGLTHLHNQYISALVQFGIIGIALLFYILYQIFIFSYKSEYAKNIAYLSTSAIYLTFLTESDHLKFILPLLLLILTISMINHKYSNIKFTKISITDFKNYICIAIFASLIAFIT